MSCNSWSWFAIAIIFLSGCTVHSAQSVKSEYISQSDASKHLVFMENGFVEFKDSNGTISLQFFKRSGGKVFVSPVGEEGETRIDGPEVDLNCDAIIVNQSGSRMTIKRVNGKPTWSRISGLIGEWKTIHR